MSKNLPVKNIATLETVLTEQEENLSALLPADMDIAFFKANVVAACAANPKLITDCTRSSLIKAVYEASELGLLVHSVLGEAWLVPYKNVATLIVGYQGKVKLLYNTGLVKLIEARTVFSNDTWECEYGLDPKLRHVEHETRGQFKGAWCKIELMTGGKLFDYYPESKLHLIREKSSGYRYFKKTGRGKEIWGDDHNTLEMYRKTVLNNLSKFIPRSGKRIAIAAEIDQRDFTDYYDVDQDAEERLYKSVGMIESAPEPEKDFEKVVSDAYIQAHQDMADELSYLFGSFAGNESYELAELVIVKKDASSDDLTTDRPEDLARISLDNILAITKMIRRAKKFLAGKSLSAEQGQQRVLAFFRFCMFNRYLLNTTRNLDAARSAFVAQEKDNA